MTVDLLFLAKNRLLFTREALATLNYTTDWGRVNELVLQDDGSVDGTYPHLAHMAGVMHGEFRHSHYGTPVAAMEDFIRRSKADLVVKVDNDTMLPPGWLGVCLGVMERNPNLELLGLENVNSAPANGGPIAYSFESAQNTGGIFIARRRIFEEHPLPLSSGTYYGFTDWQIRNDIVRAQIAPPISTFLLDRLPVEPWISLTYTYESLGWQRPWKRYSMEDSHLWSWCSERWGREMQFCA